MSGIILDTSVVSEPKRPRPDAKVRAWFEHQDADALFLTATVIGELAAGIARMARGRRRSELRLWLDRLIDREFAGRILGFDVDAALIYGELIADALAQGRPPQVADAQIAAIARQHDMALATRNVADFEPFGIALINPWGLA